MLLCAVVCVSIPAYTIGSCRVCQPVQVEEWDPDAATDAYKEYAQLVEEHLKARIRTHTHAHAHMYGLTVTALGGVGSQSCEQAGHPHPTALQADHL
jgi:hypothetical protein